jgi:hypothetical protein
MIQDTWEKLLNKHHYRNLKGPIEAALANIRKWYQRMDETDVYILAMALNPIIKLAYIRVSWDQNYIKMAEDLLAETV